MIRIIAIAVAVILMVGGGAVGVMKHFEWGPFASTTGAEETPTEPPRFIDMDPLVIPVFAEGAVITTIQIQVKLETSGAKNEELINHIMPRLSDAFLRELYAYIPRLLRRDGNLDVFAIKKRLQMVGDKVAGEKVINNVLVQSVTESRESR